MGLLSRKRKVPRIVKKVKGKTNRKKISIKQLDPRVRKHWDQNKSVQENMEQIGLKIDLNPSFKSSKEGRETLIQAQSHFAQALLSKQEKIAHELAEEEKKLSSDEEESQEEVSDEEEAVPVVKSQKPDLVEVFGIKADAKFAETPKKLNSDDVSMMRQLIKKYGDNFKAMFKDIKMNFMQYSKGQLKQRYKAFYHYGYDKKQ